MKKILQSTRFTFVGQLCPCGVIGCGGRYWKISVMVNKKPPIGIMPLWLWKEKHPNPTISQLLQRYEDVKAAIERYRQAGEPPLQKWLDEILEGE